MHWCMLGLVIPRGFIEQRPLPALTCWLRIWGRLAVSMCGAAPGRYRQQQGGPPDARLPGRRMAHRITPARAAAHPPAPPPQSLRPRLATPPASAARTRHSPAAACGWRKEASARRAASGRCQARRADSSHGRRAGGSWWGSGLPAQLLSRIAWQYRGTVGSPSSLPKVQHRHRVWPSLLRLPATVNPGLEANCGGAPQQHSSLRTWPSSRTRRPSSADRSCRVRSSSCST